MKTPRELQIPTVLLVEDDENDALFMKRALQKAGVQIDLRISPNGSDALAYFHGEGEYADRDRFPFPNLILLDLNIPYVHGLDVLRQIKHESRRTIVIVLTSSSAESDIETAYEFGATSFLLKPSTVEERVDLAKELDRYWLKRNKTAGFALPALS